MVLSLRQIEEISIAVMRDFHQVCSMGRNKTGVPVLGTPIDQLASCYLGLDVSFCRLSPDGSVLGLTAYRDAEYTMNWGGESRSIALRQNQVILEQSFLEPGRIRELCPRRRFTLAHECAHQILFHYEFDSGPETAPSSYSVYSPGIPDPPRSQEDWLEWQANALGSSLLLPQEDLLRLLDRFPSVERLISYEGRLAHRDRMLLLMICREFRVSLTTAVIRLKHLGLLEERPAAEFTYYVEI